MKNISKFEKEKLLQLLECNEVELEKLVNNSKKIIEKDYNYYDILLKILQQGNNIREATLTGILLGEKIGYKKAEIEMEEQIKDKLYRAFKNTQ
mgnify:CR=1 FL=1|tara:strand:+ start:204 stop:485 length:282 start_codon:yes stop_codon:yes gene_type:complete